MTDLTDRHDDLSDVELRVRLSQRGCPTADARAMVDHRDDPEVAQVIGEWLRGERP